MDFRPPPVTSTPIPGTLTWDPLRHLSLKSEKRWAESLQPEFPDYTPPEDDERKKFDAKHDNRKDDPTNRMYTAPVAFSSPSAPFRPTVAFKSSDEIDNELAMIEASKLMSKLPGLPKQLFSICPPEEIIGTDGDGYKVSLVNALTSKSEIEANTVDEIVHAACDNLLSLTSVDIAHAVAAIAPIFNDYYNTFIQHRCDGNLIAQMTGNGGDSVMATLLSWEITNSIHRTRIAQVFIDWRTNPPKPAPPQKSHQVKTIGATEAYSMTLKKAGTLASEIPDAVKATSLEIDQRYSHFKNLNLMPLKIEPGKRMIPSMAKVKDSSRFLKNVFDNAVHASIQLKESERPKDLTVKHQSPRGILKLSDEYSFAEEQHVSESEVIANRLISSQLSTEFDKTAATIRHLIESPVVCEAPAARHVIAHQLDNGIKGSSHPTSKLKKPQARTQPLDASPNTYSMPILPASRYSDKSDRNVLSSKCGSATQAGADASGISLENIPALILVDSVASATDSGEFEVLSGDMAKQSQRCTNASHAPKKDDSGANTVLLDLSPKKARQSSPMIGQGLGSVRVLTPKSKTEIRSCLERPGSAGHRVVWVDEAEKEEIQTNASFENTKAHGAGKLDAERTQTLEDIMCKTPLTIYLNAADKNFRPTKTKYNAGLQLLPLRQATDSAEGNFDSKQRSAGLRFGERVAGVSATGISASGVQFNPVSALFRSKRWKTCSNYPLFTSKLKASKDLQRFARLAITPRFRIDFNDERSMTVCIESLKLFALHFASVSKYDDLGQLQPEPFAREQDSIDGFFWTGLAD